MTRCLHTYGNNNLSAQAGYIRKVSNFTADLDLISEKLFALKTNGGEEYCGWVIKDALDRLEWSPSSRAYKDFKLDAVKESELPAAMQALPPAERKEFIEKKSQERAELPAKINTRNAEREKFVVAKMKSSSTTNTLESVVIITVREQAQTRAFTFQ